MFVLFQAGNNEFGINMNEVKSIQPAGNIKERLNGSQVTVELNDESMPLCDMAALTGQAASSNDHGQKRLILINVTGKTMALLVDKVDGVIEENSDQILPLPPIYKHTASRLFPKIIRRNDELVLLLDPAGITKHITIDEAPSKSETLEENTRGIATSDTEEALETVAKCSDSPEKIAPEVSSAEEVEDAVTEEAGEELSLDVAGDWGELSEENEAQDEFQAPIAEKKATSASALEDSSPDKQQMYAATTPAIIIEPTEEPTHLENDTISATHSEIEATDIQEPSQGDSLSSTAQDEILVDLPDLPDLDLLDASSEEELAQQTSLEEELKEIFAEAAQPAENPAEETGTELELTVEDLVSFQENHSDFTEAIPVVEIDDEVPMLLPLEEAISKGKSYEDIFAAPETDEKPFLERLRTEPVMELCELEPEDAINPSLFSRLFKSMKTRKKRKKAAKRRMLGK